MNRFIVMLGCALQGLPIGLSFGGAAHHFGGLPEQASVLGGMLVGLVVGALIGNYLWRRKLKSETPGQ